MGTKFQCRHQIKGARILTTAKKKKKNVDPANIEQRWERNTGGGVQEKREIERGIIVKYKQPESPPVGVQLLC